MILYPEIDPVLIRLGPLEIYWYGIMYLFGFAAAWILGRLRISKPYSAVKTPQQLENLLFYCIIGLITGAKLGYILIYNFKTILDDPLTITGMLQGGMSFHGGLIGVLMAITIYALRNKINFLDLTDFVTPLVPIGLGAGRLGNFINGELWGRVSDVPWAMIYPPLGFEPRHPSQLYQMALEGLALFTILWWFSAKPRSRGAVSGLFLAGYGFFRCFSELFRMPDPHIGYIAFGWITMGHILSLPMIIIGLFLILRSRNIKA